eukprot:m.77465 g.77465  ORF g.77465 m.77465 type:complete len:418 (+) comp10610_c0_seq2:54-1307(+)
MRLTANLPVVTAMHCLAFPAWTCGLNNGLGLTPQMGWSSWNAIGSEVNAAYVKKVTDYFVSSGLQKKGWQYINIDEGWMLGRNATTLEPIPDPHAFPEGMNGLGDYIHSKGFLYGLYSSRGVTQCARPEYRDRCIHTPPNPPIGCEGSQGYEKQDGAWIVSQGADYFKEDSCGGSQDHATAFADYARMRDVLNATGKRVFFSLCGWNPWYAPPDSTLHYLGGASLGNSWRIHGDGKNWTALSGAVNVMATLANYTGPGGWNDPDLLIGPTCNIQGVLCGNTDLQARTQLNLWSVFPAPLLISQDVLTWSAYALETYSNEAVIAINQVCQPSNSTHIAGTTLTVGVFTRMLVGRLVYGCKATTLPCLAPSQTIKADSTIAQTCGVAACRVNGLPLYLSTTGQSTSTSHVMRLALHGFH